MRRGWGLGEEGRGNVGTKTNIEMPCPPGRKISKNARIVQMDKTLEGGKSCGRSVWASLRSFEQRIHCYKFVRKNYFERFF
jgi:hypothetical protein